MKHLWLLLLCLLSLSAYSQGRATLQGSISSNGIALENVHIENISTKKYSISNRAGNFVISAMAGDTLVFSHVSMKDLIKVLQSEETSEGSIEIEMEERDNELEEVVIEEPDVDVVSVGIIDKRMEKPSVNERRLHTAGDFKPIHLLGILGGSLPIDPILNAINGRTKKLKKNISIEKEMEMIAYLENNYLDYILENFEATPGEAQQFLSYLLDKPDLELTVSAQNDQRIKFYLTDKWYGFLENKLEKEDSR